MAKIVQRDYDLKVNTWADLLAIPNPKDSMQVTVLDSIADSRTLGGTVIYQYILDFAGTADAWTIVTEINKETITTIEENLIISGGTALLSNIPNNGVLIEARLNWVEAGTSFIEDVSYSVIDNIVSVSGLYDGKNLSVKYLKNTSGKLYQLGTNPGTGSSVDLTAVNTDIIPATNGTLNIGSPTNRFNSIYVNEAHLSVNTLYLGDTPVLGTNQDTVIIKADPDQSINIKTTGLGTTSLDSTSQVNITTNGVNADVRVQAVGTNSKVRLAGDGGIELSSVTTAQNNLSVLGNLTVQFHHHPLNVLLN